MAEKKIGRLFWPSTDTVEAAAKLKRYGVGAAIFIAIINALAASWAMGANKRAFGMIDAWAFVDVALFCAIAYGIYKESRAAAICGLALFLYEKVYQVAITGQLQGAWMAAILLLCFIHAIRGAYALRRLRKLAPSAIPVTE